MKLFVFLFGFWLIQSTVFAQSRSYTMIPNFDGAQFASDYGLIAKDFWVSDGQLIIRDGVVLKDDPPIQKTTSSPTVVLHARLKALIDTHDPNGVILRAIVAVTLDELNLHALKINAILDAVDGAATLAALKTAVAAIPDYPQRTPAQLVNAIKNKIDGGTVD